MKNLAEYFGYAEYEMPVGNLLKDISAGRAKLDSDISGKAAL
jgi:hypothetical protein